MYVVTAGEMMKMDKRAIDEYGIPGIVLMEDASMQVARLVMDKCPGNLNKRICILVGSGNNGGDGLAAARILHTHGISVELVLLVEPGRLAGDARANFEMVERLRVPYCVVTKNDDLHLLVEKLKAAELLVDAIFGTGLSRPIQGVLADVIEMMNQSGVPIISVDMPSGIGGDDGRIMGAAVMASDTVTFGCPKRGQILFPGRNHVGRLHVTSISLPVDSPQAIGVQGFTLSMSEMAQRLRPRPAEGHKGTFGKVGVLAGSTGLTGAAYLTSLAALRTGAGLVTLGIPASLNPILENKLTEVMTIPFEDRGTGHLMVNALPHITEFLVDKDVLALGPGLGKSEEVFEVIRNIFGKIDISIVLDADGLNHISQDIEILKSHSKPVVITPHPGEMSRLTGKPIAEVTGSPVETAVDFAKAQGVIVVLKGAATVAAHPDGRFYLNQTGNSGMGTGGSGDVLTGLIASLIAQGYDAYEAAVNGIFIHGCAGDIAAEEMGEAGMIAGDILDRIPSALVRLYGMKEAT